MSQLKRGAGFPSRSWIEVVATQKRMDLKNFHGMTPTRKRPVALHDIGKIMFHPAEVKSSADQDDDCDGGGNPNHWTGRFGPP